MPPVISPDVGTLCYWILGPFGVLVVLLVAVRWLIGRFETEQKKREEAYFTVITMYQNELNQCNKRQDTLYIQISNLSERIHSLVEQNASLLAQLQSIQQPLTQLLTIIQEDYKRNP